MANLKAKEKCFADFNELKDKLIALIEKNGGGHVSTSDFKTPLIKVCASISVSLNNASSTTYKDQKHSNSDSFNFINIEVEKVKSSFLLSIAIDDLSCVFDSGYYSYDSGEKLNLRICTPARRNLANDKSISLNITYFDENTTYNKEKVFAFLEELFTKIKVYFTAFEMFQGEFDNFRKARTEIETEYQHKLNDLRYKLDAEKTKILKAMDIALAAALYSK